ncbi:bifunctional 5,10-methylenetetrahydrofolate dehydrogenase/5,10-methenyltetrahydrofolate cyclohydrolase [Patescibacteria group bacterium]|nr:bifunctional 5,10-methylenetetrahydrofolate dehydrogenase/5,10-methenyltetrahydrofolate cyclohydrolase [Patescibacteria group bacterium]
MHLLDGRVLAARVRAEIKDTIEKEGLHPALAVLLIGDDPASALYVGLKERAAAEVGIAFEKHLFPATVDQQTVLATITALNNRTDVDAMLIQLPLPAHLDTDALIAAMDPAKDADGFHPARLAAIERNETTEIPGVAVGIFQLIDSTGVSLKGTQATLVVNSRIFSLPLERELERRGATVVVCTTNDEREKISAETLRSTLIISAVGVPKTITGDMVHDGAILIDVGTTRLEDGSTVGDILAEDFLERDIWLTPVPGGVGPMTVAMLLTKTVQRAKKQ